MASNAGDSGVKRKRTGKYCAAFGCNSTHKDNLSLHTFPNESDRPAIRRQWINFVQVKRKDFNHPTNNSVLCEKHFHSRCYPPEYGFKKTMGIEVPRKVLLPSAVPTIHSMSDQTDHDASDKKVKSSTFSTSPPKQMRGAYRKRESKRV